MSSPPERMSETPDTSTDYFDEISGRFRSLSSTDSEESFQIVFSDSARTSRMRRPSDCESEDSFIVFEDPDNCYTSTDVFGDSEYDSDSGSDDDLSGTKDTQVTKLSNTLSRTLSDLTDGNLYEEKALDEVDCAVTSMCVEIPPEKIADASVNVPDVKSTGLLLNKEKKLLKRIQPPKKVQFSTKPPKVHVMRVWAFAARQARAGHWERCALDRDRFKRRIADVDMAVSWVLKPQHRARVMFQRFMPWWNAQKRMEQAEKKAREEELMKMLAEQENNLINGNLDSAVKEECDANVENTGKDTPGCRLDSKNIMIINDPTINVSDESFVQCSEAVNEGSKVIVNIKEPPDDHAVFKGAITNDLSMNDCNGIVIVDVVNHNDVNNEATSIGQDDKDSCNSHKSNTESVSSINDITKVNGVNKEICTAIDINKELSVCQVTSINNSISDTQTKPCDDQLNVIKCNAINKGLICSTSNDIVVIDSSKNQVNKEVIVVKYDKINNEVGNAHFKATDNKVSDKFNDVITDSALELMDKKFNNQSEKTENLNRLTGINKIDVINYNIINKELIGKLNVPATLQSSSSTLNDGKMDLIVIKDATVQFAMQSNKTSLKSSNNNTCSKILPGNNTITEQNSQTVNGIPPHELGRIIEYSLNNLELSFGSLSLY